MLYTSELTGKSYKTVKELEAAEAEMIKLQEEKEKQSSEKKARAEEVKAAYDEFIKVQEKAFAEIQNAEQKFYELRDNFAKDYGGYHYTYVNDNGKKSFSFGDLVDLFLPW